jgi:hypothetical protein
MAIDKLLKRHFWAVILALVALAAFFDAQGIMQIVGAGLGPDEKQLAAPGLAARVPRLRRRQPARDERGSPSSRATPSTR